jgi:L-iditol 2-dehydrogenase/threonine 3-dehydrogenase
VVQGHEFSAAVEATGAGVEDVAPGAKATARPQIVCGECRACRRGDSNICYDLKVEGFQAPGCAQDFFVTNAEKLVILPQDFTHEQGAMVEPCSVAVHATGRPGEIRGRNAVVLGAGTIGNLVAQMARCREANVLITDVSDFRLGVARECGIERTSNASEESLADAAGRVFGADGYDLAFDCAGAESAINQAIDNVNKGGTSVNLACVGEWELTMIGSLMYVHEDYQEAVRRIAEGAIVTEPLDSRHFPFERYEDAYHFIDEQGLQAMKVFIEL